MKCRDCPFCAHDLSAGYATCWHPTARPRLRMVELARRCCRRAPSAIAEAWEQERVEAARPVARFLAGESMEQVAADLGLSVAQVEETVRAG